MIIEKFSLEDYETLDSTENISTKKVTNPYLRPNYNWIQKANEYIAKIFETHNGDQKFKKLDYNDTSSDDDMEANKQKERQKIATDHKKQQQSLGMGSKSGLLDAVYSNINKQNKKYEKFGNESQILKPMDAFPGSNNKPTE